MQAKPHLIWRFGLVAVLAVLLIGALNHQFLLDQHALATYRPDPAVSNIESRLSLTDRARAIFYRARPKIDDKATFNQDCETDQGALELGCYYRDRIYVLEIANASLAPEMDVVMAHELLHAVWERLSQGDRDRLTRQLEAVYEGLNDSELKQRMAGYARSEPGQQGNELHSILPTELARLTPELEQYYARYFKDRGAIVAAHASYEEVFSSRRQELERELATIRNLKGQLAVVNRQLDSYRAASRVDQYNALVPRQNSLVDNINHRIERYRQGVDEYNALSHSLDSQQITDTESNVQ